MLQIVTEFCLLHLTASHAGCKYFFLSSKVHAENFSRRYMCVCIATAVDFSIQVQMNQWKIVWLPVWMNLMLLLEVVLSLVRVPSLKESEMSKYRLFKLFLFLFYQWRFHAFFIFDSNSTATHSRHVSKACSRRITIIKRIEVNV